MLFRSPLNKFDELNGEHNFGGRGVTDEENGEEQVYVSTFDSFNQWVDVIKIDIQGSELSFFNGAINTLKRCEPWLMLENCKESEKDQKVIDILRENNYEIYRLIAQGEYKEDCICINKNKSDHQRIKEYLENDLKEIYKLV